MSNYERRDPDEWDRAAYRSEQDWILSETANDPQLSIYDAMQGRGDMLRSPRR